MKRLTLHIAFWVVYIMEDTLFGYTWFRDGWTQISVAKLTWMSFLDALVCLIPKLMMTYFLFTGPIKQIAAGKVPMYRIVLEIVGALIFCVLVYNILAVYLINPHILKWARPHETIFTLSNTLQALMDIGFATGVAVAIKFVRMQLATKERERHLVRNQLESELKFLRNQTNPHFLLNTLNNVYALARKKSDDTAEVVMKLSELLRFMLYESGGKFITIGEEVKVLEDYLGLEMMRYTERLTVLFEKQIDKECYQIVPLLLLPFIENAFKHGVSESRFESFIHIDMKVNQGRLVFAVENSKDYSDRMPVKENIGLGNVRRRLELTYKDYDLRISDEMTVFKVYLSLDLESHVEI
jgi:two-component system, LytTR family, sensor kinase